MPASLATIRYVWDLTTGLQAWYSEQAVNQLLDGTQVFRVNPLLPRWIALDDATSAIQVLPGLADTEYEGRAASIQTWLDTPPPATEDAPGALRGA